MNSTQRKFLVEKIQEKTKARIKELENKKEDFPSVSNYVFKAVMNGNLKIKSEEEIIEVLRKRALNAKEGHNWLSEERMGFYKESTIRIETKDLIVYPDDYYNELKKVEKHNQSIQEEINRLKVYLDTIEIRIQLASDKTLTSLINDVDDMGDIRLIDSSLKLLNK